MDIVLGMLSIKVQEYPLFFKGEGSVVWCECTWERVNLIPGECAHA